MHDENLLENLFDQKSLNIIRLFLDDKTAEFYLREVSKESGVSVASTYRIINKLVDLNILNQIKIKKFKLYKLADNDNTKFLTGVLKEKARALDEFVQVAKKMSFIDEIILHGKEEKNKASLLLIGKDILASEIKILCGSIKHKYGFTVSSLSLTKDQYDQMSQMDLFPRMKKNLYRR